MDAQERQDVERAFQALRPEPAPDLIRGHGPVALLRRLVFIFMARGTFTAFGWRYINTVLAVGYSIQGYSIQTLMFALR
jgi:hypothetical protein